MHAAAYRGANSVVQYLFDKGAKLDVVAKDGRTPLIVADGVEYGNSFAAQPQTAVLLRKLGAKEMKCPPPCAARDPVESKAMLAKGIQEAVERRGRRSSIVLPPCRSASRRFTAHAAAPSPSPAPRAQRTHARSTAPLDDRVTSRRARQVLRHLPQPAREDRRPRARRARPGAGGRPRGRVGKSRAEDSYGRDASGRTAAAGQSAHRERRVVAGGGLDRGGARASQSGPAHASSPQPRRIPQRHPRPARARDRSRRPCCRRTTRRMASTTTPTPCRCRRR